MAIYSPVCVIFFNGTKQTLSNNCVACTNPLVK